MLKLTRTLAVFTAIVSFCNAHAAVSLLKDINQGGRPDGANADYFVVANGLTFFIANDPAHGQELWCSDGTRAGTHIVRDIAPGPLSSGIERLTVLNNVAYFFANDGVNGEELWRSDGTLSGTHIVADINKGADSSIPALAPGTIASIGAVLYFPANDGTGLGLWRSDGTAAGTYRVSDVQLLDDIVVANGQRLFFQGPGSDGGGGELWTSDGTAAGTKQLSNSFPGKAHSAAGSVTATSSGIFFVATDGIGTIKLEFTKPDGSSLHVVSDLTPMVASIGVVAMASLGPDVVFDVDAVGIYHADSNAETLVAPNIHQTNGFQPVGGRDLFSVGDNGGSDLWTTDGTASGTHQIGAALQLRADTQFILGDDGFAYFGGLQFNSPIVYSIWKTDGTDAGTTLYASQPGDALLLPGDLVSFQGKVFFTYPCGTSSQCLWVSDGTPSGTSVVFDPTPDSTVLTVESSGSALFFISAISEQLFTSDGTTAGTHSLVTLSTQSQGADSQPFGFTSLGSKVMFVANDGIHGNELWLSDKSTHATSMLADLNPGSGDGVDTTLVGIGGQILFGGSDGVHGEQLWITDGTTSGTTVLANVAPELDPWNVVVSGGVAFFPADDGVHGFQPWRSDGTAAGTYMVADIVQESFVSNFRAFNGQVMFYSQTLLQWWISDGTAEGAHAVTPAGTANVLQATLNGLFYFAGISNGASTGDLWVTDGTAAGTHIALTLTSEFITNVYGLSNRIVLQTQSTDPSMNFRPALFGTDGTSAGTAQVALDSLSASVAVGNQLIYSISNSDGSTEIRATDGTAAGTRDITKVDSVGPLMGAYKDTAIFSSARIVSTPSVGSIWRSDGTPQGTQLVASGITGTWFQAIDNALYFQGVTWATGAEPFVIDELSPNTAPDGASTSADTAVTIDVLANDGSLASTLMPSSVAISIAPQNGSTSIDPSTGKITYTPTKGFSGTDTFAYIVMDALGQDSSPTSVDIAVGAEAGPPPGSPPGGSGSGPGGSGSSPTQSKGGGGELSLVELMAGALVLLLRSAASLGAGRRRSGDWGGSK